MDRSGEQAGALTAGVLRCLRCLGRLRERCDKKLSRDDPRRRAVYAAYDAAFTLRLKVHHLECDATRQRCPNPGGPHDH